MNKSLITDFVSVAFVSLSFFVIEPYSHIALYIGLFALSGAITNQIAIHMLFERVPLFYGSGVIELRFEAFKKSIKNLMMNQFFTKEQLESFFEKEEKKIDLEPIIKESDFTSAFDALVNSVMESQFGGMLNMFGGVKALEGLKEPFIEKLKSSFIEISKSEEFNENLQKHLKSSAISDDFLNTIESMIDKRLNELTPKMVKEIVQDFIKEHLGWLVVWGGFFGGLIGLASSLLLS